MNKIIWLVNKYAMPPQYESRLRTIKFAHYLQEMGYRVTIFGSSVMHNMDLDLIEDGSRYIERQYNDLKFVHIKSCKYKNTAGLGRIWGDIKFHYRLVRLAKRFEKPDVVIATTFSLVSNPIMKYCHKHDIKYITEVLDWWPDGFVNFGLVSAKNPVMKYLFWRARKNYVDSDASVFSAEGCFKYLEDKGWDKDHGGPVDLSRVYYINNGVDLNDFDSWKTQYTIDDPDLYSDKKRILYMGSIRLVNNVEQLVKAAEILRDRDDVVFLVYGNGEDREPLIKYCEEHYLSNVKFKDKWIEPKYVPFVLSQSYLNVMNYATVVGRYGISSSKMFQYMASGKPIVCNVNIMYSPIEKNNIGVSRKMRDAQDYADTLLSVLNLPNDEYKAMCERARKASEEYDYSYLTSKMAQVIENVID